MFIGSLASYLWTSPFLSPPGGGAATGTDPAPSSAFFNSIQAGLGTSGSNRDASGTATPFQQLAADIQAVLVEGQGAAATSTTSTAGTSSGSGTTATSTAGGTTSNDPAQQLAAAMQAIYAQMQGSQSGSDPSMQASATNQTDATSEIQPHHHHHHHGGGTSAGASETGETTASSTGTAPGTSASSNVQAASQTFAADVLQALRAYASTGSSTASSGLTA